MNKVNKFNAKIFWLAIILLAFSAASFGQTTAFTYQGRFNDTNVPSPTNGSYNMQFALYTPQTGGTYLGSPITIPNVQVTNGIFTVTLDFDAGNPTSFFGGGSRFLEIRVFDTATNAYITLSPQQEITSTPYAIRAKSAENAVSLGGVLAGQFPTIGQVIFNQTTTQAGANFNIGGKGTANIFEATTQYNIEGFRVLALPNLRQNIVAGLGSGNNISTGVLNAFYGNQSGNRNNTGDLNSFFGNSSGFNNTSGANNSFFGAESGFANNQGNENSFFGRSAGSNNISGTGNSFFGSSSGSSNQTSNNNSFFGYKSGENSTAGSNSFFGSFSGQDNTNGAGNAFFGWLAGDSNTTGSSNSFFGTFAGEQNLTGSNNTMIGYNADVTAGNLSYATAIGAGATVNASNTITLGRSDSSDKVRIPGLGAAGSTPLCRNTNNEVSTCSSSLRYKTNIAPFLSGLSFINQLHPISFDWTEGGMKDIGFGAEDVAKINPLFVNYNEKGEVEGVKYDRFSVVFVNAIKEQQTQIADQKEQIELLKTQNQNQQFLINELQKLVCLSNKDAEICKEKK